MNVQLYQPGPPLLSNRQTNAAANQFQAQAYRSSDPRAMANAFSRRGMSRGAGQYSLGAAAGAQNYADNMARSQQARMDDAYSNANQSLAARERDERFGTALAGLSDDIANTRWNDNMDMFQQGYNLLNGLFGGFGGSR
jgi:hypothetical protein